MGRVHDLLRDWWLPLVLAPLALTETFLSYADHPAGTTALLSVLLPMALVTAARRRSPVPVALAETVLVAVVSLALEESVADQPPLTPFLCLLATLFNLGVHGAGRTFVAAATAIGAALTGLQVAAFVAGQQWGDLVPSALFLAGAFALGRALHHTHGQAAEARTRAELAERTREDHARAAADAERARIARELHDVVAHALTGIVVQASVEARLQTDQDSTATATLRTIERQGRDAMVELRRLLGLLRQDGQRPADAPLPTLAGADGLAEDLRRAGHQVTLDRRGELDGLPTGVDLAAYRVLQEGLTNASRHAPGAPVRVVVAREDETVRVRVESDAARTESPGLGHGGHGLVGLRERVRLYGGQLRAAPTAEGGFLLDAEIPLSTVEPGEGP